MSAPVTSIPQRTGTTHSNTPHPRSRKTRVVRRRGRAKFDESDEEIEREVTSDDESDDDRSSLESASESESLSDDGHHNGRSEVVTPSTTQSPPPLEIDGRTPLARSKPTSLVGEAGPFVTATDWADMVSNEHANGTAELPVIDFADLDRQRIDQHLVSPHPPPKKHRKQAKRAAADRASSARPATPPARVIQPEEEAQPPSSEEPARESQPRVRGQSARQAYQQRLENDPSFVPKVGEFWGHDDRLLDKEYRSLSGWWRGRWQSRGRGRGGFSMRGRGRGFFGRFDGGRDAEGEGTPTEDVPPVEKPWTHDGFEEMKRRDEKRRELELQRAGEQEQQQEQPQASQVRFSPQRGFGFRGRGGFFGGRGRGAFTRGSSGGDSPVRVSASSMPVAERVWFAMKPERMWTKQHEAFLYFDTAMKPRPGMGPGYRVKLPGTENQVIRAPPRPYHRSQVGFSSPTSASQDEVEKAAFVIRLPRPVGKGTASEEPVPAPTPEATAEEPVTTMAELSLEEVFTVRPNLVPNRRIDLSASQSTASSTTSMPSSSTPQAPPSGLPIPPRSLSSPKITTVSSMSTSRSDPFALQPLIVRPSSASPSPQIKETVLRRASISTQSSTVPNVPAPQAERPAPPVLPPLQTNFSPVPQTSPPPYGSPYAYAPALPPGVALNQHGMPYELATGRPVYLHQPTPPPMFTPRPVMYTHTPHPSMSAPFVPAHMHHHSHSHSVASPDFLAQSHTPPMQFIDPSTGVPIFTPARQTSRIEIRAPTDAADGKKHSSRPSGLRVSSSDGQETSQHPQEGASAPRSDANGDPPVSHQGEPAPAMAYYPQQYYYPDPYAYSAYMDMPPQVMPYEMYPSDHHRTHHQPQPPMIYY